MKIPPRLAILGLVSLFTTSTATAGDGWETDLAKARETARAEGKSILLNFTGSDWCGACQQIGRTILSRPEFIAKASENYVLLEVDLPDRIRQSAALRAQNENLAGQFRVNMFPTFIILDADGDVVARNTGPPGRGIPGFLAWLERNR